MPDAFREVSSQVRAATLALVERGLVADQNLPSVRGSGRNGVITVDSDVAYSDLHGLRYHDLYEIVSEYRAFNMKFRDGGILQLHYEFRRRAVSHHRLAFLPSPDLESLQSEPESYLDDSQELFADVLEPQTVGVPLRFDHDISAARSVEHPASHLTLGMFTNCRIPATAPLYPLQFMDFVLRHFYNSSYATFSAHLPVSDAHFPVCATEEEYGLVHVGIPRASRVL